MARKLLEAIRDRLVHRSLIGKRKLDRSSTRRALDDALRDLGEKYRVMMRSGRVNIPAEMANEVDRVEALETKLEAQDKEIEALENEQPSTT